MDNTVFLPTLSHFENGNGFLGSFGSLRFAADRPVEGAIAVSAWRGLLCREQSTMEAAETFPVTEDGLLAMRDWLLTQASG